MLLLAASDSFFSNLGLMDRPVVVGHVMDDARYESVEEGLSSVTP